MADKKTTAADIHKLIKEKEIKYVDVRFTDPRGKWQHVTFDLMMVDDDFLERRHHVEVPPSPAGRRSTSPTCCLPDPTPR